MNRQRMFTMTMMSLIKGHTSIFQCIGDAYVKGDIQRFHYGYILCIKAGTNMKTLYKYLNNRHDFSRQKCADMLKQARK